MNLPTLIQGGMGAGASLWPLARTVSMHDKCLGTISGTALDQILWWFLQNGDPDGHYREALSHFPFQDVVQRVIDKRFNENGKSKFKRSPVISINPSNDLIDLIVCANFAEVWLAKQGHNNPVNINYLEKIQVPHIYSIYGAMLAGVDWITVGAGIPNQIPKILDLFAKGEPAEYHVNVENSDNYQLSFDPKEYFGGLVKLKRPKFLPIAASNTLAKKLVRNGGVDGFIIEGPTAGGHNAPPRKKSYNDKGDQVFEYTEEDKVDLNKIIKLNVPFWLAGSQASPEALECAVVQGANGVQVGSAFALCQESNIKEEFKKTIRELGYRGELQVLTSNDSSTGYPFQVAQVDGTLSADSAYEKRIRRCDKKYLVTYRRDTNGNIYSYCSAEPGSEFVQGKRCLCNGLLAAIGMNPDPQELPILTLGKDLSFLQHLSDSEGKEHSARDVIEYILNSQT